MRRFFTRHMSPSRHARYKLLSCSDSQLDSTLQSSTKVGSCDRTEDPSATPNVSQARRRWYNLSRRKKRGKSEPNHERAVETLSARTEHEEAELAVEASPCHDEEDTCNRHASLTQSTSMLDMRNSINDVGHYAQINRTGVMPTVTHEHFPARMYASGLLKPSHLENRRFAICEELERQIMMEDGVNLRKSRKNLVIRQVLHELLLL